MLEIVNSTVLEEPFVNVWLRRLSMIKPLLLMVQVGEGATKDIGVIEQAVETL